MRDDRGRLGRARSACSPTTATRRRTRGGRFARARTSCSATPTWCTRASCRTIRAGRSSSRTCATSSSTSCTRTAACSAATCATCCGGCGASAGTTGRIPAFLCSSATIANPRELAERLTEQPFELVEQKRRAARREVLRVRQPAGRQPSARHPAVVSERDAARRVGVPEAQPAADRVRAEPAVHRDPHDVPEGRLRGRAGRAGAHPRLPRRLPAEPAPRNREGPARGQRPRGRVDQRARARHRHRRARRERDGRLSGHDCRHLAARRARRAAARAGRRRCMVASSAPLDQFVVRNPSYFFDASPERALIDPDNLHILVDHIKCAAFELPFTGAEAFGRHDVQEILGLLAEQGLVHLRRRGRATTSATWNWTNESYPADAVSLRSVSSDNFVIVDTTGEPRVIGETDFTSGPSTLHPKAIYIVEGEAVSGGAARFRGPQGVRARDRLRLLHRRDHVHARHRPRHVRRRGRRRPTARSTSCRASSASRRSSSTRTRTSARASSICPSSRCTRRRTG